MIPKIDIGDAEFGADACSFSALAGMYGGEENKPAHRPSAASTATSATCAPAGRSLRALRTAFVRVITALRELADELDAVGLSPMGTSALNEAREFGSMMVAALQRLERANDNTHSRKTA